MKTIRYDIPFIAVIGDIKNSREISERHAVQKKLQQVLEKINGDYEEDITSKFIITLGDEFQGLLSKGKHLLDIIQEIKMQLYPIEIRFGIGVGPITTDIDTEMALGADGPGYYMARQAIEALRKNEKGKKAVSSNIRLEVTSGNDKQLSLVNTVFELLNVIEKGWSKRQRDVIWDMMRHRDGQVHTAQRLGVVQSTIQKSLVTGNYYAYEKALDELRQIFGEITI